MPVETSSAKAAIAPSQVPCISDSCLPEPESSVDTGRNLGAGRGACMSRPVGGLRAEKGGERMNDAESGQGDFWIGRGGTFTDIASRPPDGGNASPTAPAERG